MEAPETAEQDVIRAPAADPASPEERPDDRCVAEPFERRELTFAGRRRVREFEDRLGPISRQRRQRLRPTPDRSLSQP